MVGGEIWGYCAMGRVRREMVPRSTMIMEMTMAKIGRLIKNFDMGSSLLRRHGCSS